MFGLHITGSLEYKLLAETALRSAQWVKTVLAADLKIFSQIFSQPGLNVGQILKFTALNERHVSKGWDFDIQTFSLNVILWVIFAVIFVAAVKRRLNAHYIYICLTNLGLGGVVLLDIFPVLSVQAMEHPKPLHKDVPVSVFPSLDHNAAHHLVLAQIHLQGRTRKGWFDFTDKLNDWLTDLLINDYTAHCCCSLYLQQKGTKGFSIWLTN